MKTIELTQGKVALVDDADFRAVNQFKWYAWRGNQKSFYAARNQKTPAGWRPILLHTFILPAAKEVHHKNGDSLDNRRRNLRSVSHAENMRGIRRKASSATSRFRGVYWHQAAKKWAAVIEKARRRQHLGLYVSERDAAHAYDAAAKELFGEFASPNFP